MLFVSILALFAVVVQGVAHPGTLSIGAVNNSAPYNGKTVHANGGKFWVGKPTKALCSPEAEKDGYCPRCPETLVNNLPSQTREFFLDSYFPVFGNGQQIYVAEDSSMSFLLNDEKLPASAITYKFIIDMVGGIHAIKNGGVYQPYLCPTGKGIQAQVFWNFTALPGCEFAGELYAYATYGAYRYG